MGHSVGRNRHKQIPQSTGDTRESAKRTCGFRIPWWKPQRVCQSVGLEGSPATRWTQPLRTLTTTGKSEALRTWSAASRVCSRAMMWSRLASSACLFVSPQQGFRCDGLWSAPMGASKEDPGQWTADWKQRARLTWLLRVSRIASPTYRSTIDNDLSSKRFAGLVNSCEACEVRGTWLLKATYRSTFVGNHRASERHGASKVQTPQQPAELNRRVFPHLSCGTGFRQAFNNNSAIRESIEARSTAIALVPL